MFVLRFSEPLFIAAVVLLLKFFFSGKDILFSFSIIGIDIVGHRDGLMEGLMIGSRILGAVAIVALVGFSTPFTEFMAGLSWLRVPKGFIEILMFAYRYIFVLLDDANVIYSAQKNRLGYSSMRRGLSSFGVLAGSLTLKAFDNSHNTTVAMVQRGYDGNMPLLRHKSFKLSEIAASVVFVAGMGFLWKL
jgi:cobalt/nickel transport system permease protein